MTNEIFNYFANAMNENDDANDASMHIHCAIDEMCFRLDVKMSYDERREIVNAYYDLFDDEFRSSFEFVSYLHAYSFAILQMYEIARIKRANATMHAHDA